MTPFDLNLHFLLELTAVRLRAKFVILGPPNISRTVEAKNFKFGTETDGVSSNAKKMQN